MLKAYVAAQTAMDTARHRLATLRDDKSGAALIEYSLLIGLIVVGAIAMITAVGGKVLNKWTTLNTQFT